MSDYIKTKLHDDLEDMNGEVATLPAAHLFKVNDKDLKPQPNAKKHIWLCKVCITASMT